MSEEWTWNELGAVAERVLRRAQAARMRRVRHQPMTGPGWMRAVQDTLSRKPSEVAKFAGQRNAQLELPLFVVEDGSPGQAARFR